MSEQTLPPPSFRGYHVAYAMVALAILAIPLIAMQMTSEVRWGVLDFLVFAGMLFALGAAIELAIRHIASRWARAVMIALSLAGFMLVWAMLST